MIPSLSDGSAPWRLSCFSLSGSSGRADAAQAKYSTKSAAAQRANNRGGFCAYFCSCGSIFFFRQCISLFKITEMPDILKKSGDKWIKLRYNRGNLPPFLPERAFGGTGLPRRTGFRLFRQSAAQKFFRIVSAQGCVPARRSAWSDFGRRRMERRFFIFPDCARTGNSVFRSRTSSCKSGVCLCSDSSASAL